jgi:anti-sigma factor RsiW
MKCRELRERISISIDGEASTEEARLVEEHLEGCGECRAIERKMRAVGTGVARAEGVVPTDFREKLFARMEAEDLLPRRRSIFAFSIRWAAVPLAAAAALALFLLSSPEKVREPSTSADTPRAQSAAAPGREDAAIARVAPELTQEERDIIAHLDVLEDPSDLDAPGEVDEMEIFVPSRRRQG